MTNVMVFGSFDVIHPGHLYFLRKAKSYGDTLVAVIARDSTIEKVKGKKPKYNERERREHMRELGYANKVILGYETDPYKIVEEINPDVICLGYDQDSFSEGLREEIIKRNLKAKVYRLDAYRAYMYKSSKLK